MNGDLWWQEQELVVSSEREDEGKEILGGYEIC